ncbi:ParB N-terminal domain-containing protein [Oceaniradius stylonematis]|uniref:ParB N-terminal domain-containing protein n=1 Tax=Oceaniradius stylonematis TaxID=2184161 RepID=UPI003B595BB1
MSDADLPAKAPALRPIEVRGGQRPAQFEPGAAPILDWLRIDALVVDERYQRDLLPGNWKAIRRIAEQFRWSHFSPVFVAPAEGGKYAIIDGQHRTHAAALCGIERVPCQIVQLALNEQAAAFAAVNGLVTKVTPFHIFRAALTAGETWAVRARDVAEAGNCRLMTRNMTNTDKKPGQIFAVRTFCKLIEQHGAEAVSNAIGLMRRTEGFADQAELWDSTILRAVIMALVERPAFIGSSAAADMLADFDVWEAVERADMHRRKSLRMGLTPTPRHEMLNTYVLDFVDQRFGKVRMALPQAGGAGGGDG